MELTFVARDDDGTALGALSILRGLGYPTRTISQQELPHPTSVGLFGSDGDFRNAFLRIAKHRMRDEGFEIPSWTDGLPFVAAIKRDSAHIGVREYRLALKHLAEQLAAWEPWMKDTEAPWRPTWHRNAAHDRFPAWREQAAQALPPATIGERMTKRLAPIFTPTDTGTIERAIITGCALFNSPHTDVTDQIPDRTQRVVTGILSTLLSEFGCDAEFIVPGGDLLDARLRDHFHPFMFMSVADVESATGIKKLWRARLFGDSHAHERTDSEIAAALDASAGAIIRQIVEPSAAKSGQVIRHRRWSDVIGPYLDEAYRIARSDKVVATAIYQARVASRPSYKSLHAIDPERGLARTIANNVFYIAEAMYLYEHPNVAIVNCEHEDTFWRGLESLLAEKVWGSWRPLVGMVPKPARQPWGY